MSVDAWRQNGLSQSNCHWDRVYIALRSWAPFEVAPEEKSQMVQLFLSKYGRDKLSNPNPPDKKVSFLLMPPPSLAGRGSAPHLLTPGPSWRERPSSETCHQGRGRKGVWPSTLTHEAPLRSTTRSSLPKHIPRPATLNFQGAAIPHVLEGGQLDIFGDSTNDTCAIHGIVAMYRVFPMCPNFC